jgi:GMP reductase
LCIDVANGYQNSFVEKCKMIRKLCPNAFIMAGNVVTGDMVSELVLNAGISCVKVGIGGGSVCNSRIVAAVGFPQLSCAYECADYAHQLSQYICSDGGCTIPGDVCKAFGANADFVMLGGMLAGTEESGGEMVSRTFMTNEVEMYNGNFAHNIYQTKQFKKFYGMSSKEAQDKHNGGLAEYKASEGKCIEVEYRGPVDVVIKDILGGLRSACTYVGARTLKDFPKCVTFIRVGMQENQVFSKK